VDSTWVFKQQRKLLNIAIEFKKETLVAAAVEGE
jgi:hypothetical protein